MRSILYMLLNLALLAGWADIAMANNLQVTNLLVRWNTTNTAIVQFNIAWENSWRYTNVNHDAAWVFFKVLPEGSNDWQHVRLEGTGLNPPGYKTGSGTGIELIVPDDHVGLFVRRSTEGSGAVAVQNIQAIWNFASNSLTTSSKVRMRALAIEMVYVASGSFYVGDGSTTTNRGQFEDGTGNAPFLVTNEAYGITLGGGSAGSIGNRNCTNMVASDDFNYTVSQNLPVEFPKGFAAFYCMKYELSQGQFVDFLNLLKRAQQNALTSTQTADYFALNNRTNVYRGDAIRCPSVIPASPEAIVFGCDANQNKIFNEDADAMDRACTDLTTARGWAFADWAGLRPMTELEFEKACRGPETPVADEQAWGNTNWVLQTGHDITGGPVGSGRETALPVNANINTGRKMDGGVRVGIYATGSSSRESAGATYWGIMDMSGSLYEHVISVGTAAGRLFTGLHGDGILSSAGNADVSGWPSTGCGRGGEWYLNYLNTRVSDRVFGAYDLPWIGRGFRGVRTAPGGIGP